VALGARRLINHFVVIVTVLVYNFDGIARSLLYFNYSFMHALAPASVQGSA